MKIVRFKGVKVRMYKGMQIVRFKGMKVRMYKGADGLPLYSSPSRVGELRILEHRLHQLHQSDLRRE